ncbi:MAG: hypothetical protein ACLTG0_10945 [Oscillibacter sp.]
MTLPEKPNSKNQRYVKAIILDLKLALGVTMSSRSDFQHFKKKGADTEKHGVGAF